MYPLSTHPVCLDRYTDTRAMRDGADMYASVNGRWGVDCMCVVIVIHLHHVEAVVAHARTSQGDVSTVSCAVWGWGSRNMCARNVYSFLCMYRMCVYVCSHVCMHAC